ncbi:hypothetical protein OG912_24955 [Streptomyces sp. NBC_00464]|uniref:hypothetical protein n=1 Tax=Streptomyces sp. NBC_00464 TaxID=2975751 RepID=UPI002E19F591
MKLAVIVSVILVVGAIVGIGRLFVRDHKIETHGRDIKAQVEDIRHVGTNDGGSFEIAYRLSWREGDARRTVDGRDTVLASRMPQLQKGCEVDIKYLDDAHILFVFNA